MKRPPLCQMIRAAQNRLFVRQALVLLMAGLTWSGCSRRTSQLALVLTEVPVAATPGVTAGQPEHSDVLDERYPSGSRVVLVDAPYYSNSVRVLSKGLSAAGDPVVAADGQTIYFSGKKRAGELWQIFRANPASSAPTQMTSMRGGAMSPTVIAGGTLVFSAPVPNRGAPSSASLYAQAAHKSPQRLTFGTTSATEPSALADGRILFISTPPTSGSPLSLGLCTINNDGTEVSRFAINHDGATSVRRPRELPNRQVAFLSHPKEAAGDSGTPETVDSGRPFASRAPLAGLEERRCSSLEPAASNALLVCAETAAAASVVYRTQPGTQTLGDPVFADRRWNIIEAIPLTPHAAPMGHLSTLEPDGKTGTLLCLNAGFTRPAASGDSAGPTPVRLRVLTGNGRSHCASLGEIPLQSDGSFMAEVPANLPLGFETLDAAGQVLQRLPPSFWVRPGENRSCLGCHEPPNRAPHNTRPLAVAFPPTVLTNRVAQ